MSTKTVNTSVKVFYAVMWKGVILEYEFADNAQYLEVVSVAEKGIINMMRKGASIEHLKVYMTNSLNVLFRSLLPVLISKKRAHQSELDSLQVPSLDRDDVLPVWKDLIEQKYQEWFSIYHILKKLKYVGEEGHHWVKEIFPGDKYEEEEEEEEEEPVVQSERSKKKNEKIGLCQVCETETHRRCSCKEIYYCSGDCQKTHWKTHKKNCKK